MIDRYRHLNQHGDGLVVGIEAIAEAVDGLNYGTHRLLSAIARRRLEKDPRDPMGKALRELLLQDVNGVF